MHPLACIYQIRHVASGKLYVGAASSRPRRWWLHRKQLRAGTHHSPHLQNAWNCYGEDAFVFEEIERVADIDQLFAREQHYLDTLRPEYNVSKIAGFNVRLGSKETPEQRTRRSASMMGNSHGRGNAGRRHTPETIARIAANRKGKGLGRKPSPRLNESLREYHASLTPTERALRHPRDPKTGRMIKKAVIA